MDIKELEVKINKRLNPKLWEDKKLKRDVREAIIDIVSEFMDNLIIPVEILDVRVTLDEPEKLVDD